PLHATMHLVSSSCCSPRKCNVDMIIVFPSFFHFKLQVVDFRHILSAGEAGKGAKRKIRFGETAAAAVQ
ncbi:hypothetical protein P9857_16120, partial [Anoxybacillus geothermalis]|nr:hypothetical protein [Anoxybacillus geothermalis]